MPAPEIPNYGHESNATTHGLTITVPVYLMAKRSSVWPRAAIKIAAGENPRSWQEGPRQFHTAFENRRTMQTFVAHIAWESEVWIAEDPDQMIHFNGERFLGPYPDVMPNSQ